MGSPRALRRLTAVLGAALWLCPAGTARSEDPSPPETLLASGDPVKRIEGLDALEKAGKSPERERLALKALGDADWGVAIRAAKALTTLGGDASIEPLARVAVDGEIIWLRRAATEAVRTIDSNAAAGKVFHAISVARRADQKVHALDALARLAGPVHLKRIRPLTHDKDPAVQAAAVIALGAIARDPSVLADVLAVVEKILEARDDRGTFLVYAAALEALGALDLPRARALLAAEVAAGSDLDDYVGIRVARMLLTASPEARAEALADAWPSAKLPHALRRMARLAGRLLAPNARELILPLLAHKEDRVRSEAVAALRVLGEREAVPAVEPLLDDKSVFVRLEAWRALGALEEPPALRARSAKAEADEAEEVRLQYVVLLFDQGEPEGIPLLEGFFRGKGWRVPSAAIAAAGALGVAEDLPRFLPLLDHKDWRIRGAAFEALGRLRAATAFPHLIAGLADKEPVVKGVCHANLQILSSQRLSADPKVWNRWWDQHGSDLVLIKHSRKKAGEKAEPLEPRNAPEAYVRKRGVEMLQKARILVVTGAWDHAERVLDHLGIPATTLRAQELKKTGLNPNQVVLVNCEGSVDADSAERLQWFVNVGGYLMSSDWALTNAVRECFPGHATPFAAASTGNDDVVVEESSPGHAYTAGMFDMAPALQWWLEFQAYPIVVQWPERVDVLIDSRQMRHRYGASPMAVTFRWGLGKVLHSVSHFYLQVDAFTKFTKPRERMIFAADGLGLPLDDVRRLADQGRFDGAMSEDTVKDIAPDYSMFRMIVQFVGEKSRWIEKL